MNDFEIINRKILLKKQALRLMKAEFEKLVIRKNLMRLGAIFEARMKSGYDHELSGKLDCVNTLLESS